MSVVGAVFVTALVEGAKTYFKVFCFMRRGGDTQSLIDLAFYSL